ncbi:MAG: tRNA guanosine(34) transglycosylase Tgt, partial [Tistlia sp.]
AERPRYLMGVGRPQDLVESVRRGIDMFDCVLPTRSGRTGRAYTGRGELNLKNARHRDDPRPLDAACGCAVCSGYGRAYLHHLFRAGEMLGPILLTLHNLTFYQVLMRDLRAAIEAGSLETVAAGFLEAYGRGDLAELAGAP